MADEGVIIKLNIQFGGPFAKCFCISGFFFFNLVRCPNPDDNIPLALIF